MLAETRRLRDARGSFARLFCNAALQPALGSRFIVQINHSTTSAVGSIRGLHYQSPPAAEMKLVRCLRGRVFDVMLDLRSGSQTFLKWYGVELSAENDLMAVIPEGFAHGFQVLEPDSELLYLHTAAYSPAAEAGISPLDPMVGIEWPLPVGEMSDRDRNHPWLDADFSGVSI